MSSNKKKKCIICSNVIFNKAPHSIYCKSCAIEKESSDRARQGKEWRLRNPDYHRKWVKINGQ